MTKARNDADYWAGIADEVECLRPVCPTCGGTGQVERPMGDRRHPLVCPENGGNCDGKVTVERMAKLWNYINDDLNWHGNAAELIEHLWAIR